MGRIGSKRQDKSASEISLKLHEELNVTKEDAFKFWTKYQQYRKEHICSIWSIMYQLNDDFDKNIMRYFAALAMEIISKEIIEGIKE